MIYISYHLVMQNGPFNLIHDDIYSKIAFAPRTFLLLPQLKENLNHIHLVVRCLSSTVHEKAALKK
jgi:hypothetical protein